MLKTPRPGTHNAVRGESLLFVGSHFFGKNLGWCCGNMEPFLALFPGVVTYPGVTSVVAVSLPGNWNLRGDPTSF